MPTLTSHDLKEKTRSILEIANFKLTDFFSQEEQKIFLRTLTSTMQSFYSKYHTFPPEGINLAIERQLQNESLSEKYKISLKQNLSFDNDHQRISSLLLRSMIVSILEKWKIDYPNVHKIEEADIVSSVPISYFSLLLNRIKVIPYTIKYYKAFQIICEVSGEVMNMANFSFSQTVNSNYGLFRYSPHFLFQQQKEHFEKLWAIETIIHVLLTNESKFSPTLIENNIMLNDAQVRKILSQGIEKYGVQDDVESLKESLSSELSNITYLDANPAYKIM